MMKPGEDEGRSTESQRERGEAVSGKKVWETEMEPSSRPFTAIITL